MKTDFFELSDGRIHYLKFGKGERLLIALHGFAARANVFAVLEESLGAHYTIYAIDLPFHGETEWKSDKYGKEDMGAVIREILSKEDKAHFEWMGHSFGGRIVLSMLGLFRDQLDGVYLLAPDGLQTRRMFLPSIIPSPLRRRLKRLLQDPGRFLRFVGFCYRAGLIGSFVNKYLHNHLRSPERRERLFNTWFSMAEFKVHQARIRRVLTESNLRTIIILGRQDPLIRAGVVKKLGKSLPQVSVQLLEREHLLIDQELAEVILFSL